MIKMINYVFWAEQVGGRFPPRVKDSNVIHS